MASSNTNNNGPYTLYVPTGCFMSISVSYPFHFPSNVITLGEVAPGLDELASLLTSQNLGKYTDVFLRHEVDLQTFATLTDEELKEIGIPTFGARKKLLLLARETKKKYGVS